MTKVTKESILDVVDSLLGQLKVETSPAAPRPQKKSKIRKVKVDKSKKRGKPKQTAAHPVDITETRVQERESLQIADTELKTVSSTTLTDDHKFEGVKQLKAQRKSNVSTHIAKFKQS